jgi:hypothetical protein
MKNKILLSIAFIILFISIIIFISSRKSKVTDLDAAFIEQPTPQKIEKRIWRSINFEEIGKSDEFISSLHMHFGYDNKIYVADNNVKALKKFDLNGILIKSIGKNEGRGPEEFSIIVDILNDRLGRIWIMDDQNNRATIYNSKNDTISKIIDFPFVFNRIVPIDDSEYWVQKRFDNQLQKYSLSGQHIEDLHPIVDDPELWSFVLESYSALASDGSVIQSQYHTNMFLRYSKEGKIIYYREPIIFLGLPNIDPYYANEVGIMNTVDFSSWKQITRNPQVVDTSIHLFVHQKMAETDKWKQGFIDVYNLNNGDYLYSYELPESLESIAVSKNHIAGISEKQGKLIVWRLN